MYSSSTLATTARIVPLTYTDSVVGDDDDVDDDDGGAGGLPASNWAPHLGSGDVTEMDSAGAEGGAVGAGKEDGAQRIPHFYAPTRMCNIFVVIICGATSTTVASVATLYAVVDSSPLSPP